MAYVFSFWTCYVLYKEYKIVTSMRLQFLASENRRPDQFTVSLFLNFSLPLYILQLDPIKLLLMLITSEHR